MAVIFDSYIHSGKIRDDIRNMKGFTEVPPAQGGDEKRWITQYIAAREKWLLTRKDPILKKTVYRMATFKAAIKRNNWDLKLPVFALGQEIKNMMSKLSLFDTSGYTHVIEEKPKKTVVRRRRR